MQKPEPCFVRCSAAVSRKQQLKISPRRSCMVRFFTVQLTLSTTQFGAKFWAAKTTIKSEKFFLVKLSDICFIGEGKRILPNHLIVLWNLNIVTSICRLRKFLTVVFFKNSFGFQCETFRVSDYFFLTSISFLAFLKEFELWNFWRDDDVFCVYLSQWEYNKCEWTVWITNFVIVLQFSAVCVWLWLIKI